MAKILIIGGGVAGLSAGIYARLSGHEAVICEKYFVAGGNLTGWQRGEYHIDNCIHWLTGTNKNSSLYSMWEDIGMLGEGVGIVQENSLISCERDGVRVSLPPSLSALRREMLSISSEDSKRK
jgi:phytoene dehydrogenase-like protein